MKNENQGAAD